MIRRTLKVVSVVSVAIVLATASGCVRRSADGGQQVFSYNLWVPMMACLGGSAAVFGGFFLRRRMPRPACMMVVVGFLAIVGLMPKLFRDQVVVRGDGFAVQTIILWNTNVYDVNYGDLQRLEVAAMEQETGSRGRRYLQRHLLCRRKDGACIDVPINTEPIEKALAHILQGAKDHGVPVTTE